VTDMGFTNARIGFSYERPEEMAFLERAEVWRLGLGGRRLTHQKQKAVSECAIISPASKRIVVLKMISNPSD
jgi:hypothetical protein